MTLIAHSLLIIGLAFVSAHSFSIGVNGAGMFWGIIAFMLFLLWGPRE